MKYYERWPNPYGDSPHQDQPGPRDWPSESVVDAAEVDVEKYDPQLDPDLDPR